MDEKEEVKGWPEFAESHTSERTIAVKLGTIETREDVL